MARTITPNKDSKLCSDCGQEIQKSPEMIDGLGHVSPLSGIVTEQTPTGMMVKAAQAQVCNDCYKKELDEFQAKDQPQE